MRAKEMSKGYWNQVPVGTWKIVDPEDIIAALKDEESTYVMNSSKERLHIFGPPKKALIADLQAIKETITTEEYDFLLIRIFKITGLRPGKC